MRLPLALACCSLLSACDRKDPPEAPKVASSASAAKSAASSAPVASTSSPSVAPTASAPKKVVEGRTIDAWQGTIGKDLKFDLYLERLGDELTGLYVPGGSGVHVPLQGKMKDATHFTLTELDEKGKPAGTFDGTFTGGVLKGNYTDAKTKKARIFTTEAHHSDLPATFTQGYAGTLGGKIRIRAKIEKKDATFGGVYRYAKSKDDLVLTGAIDKGAEFVMRETVKSGKETGRFEGFALSKYLLVGRWYSPDKTKSLPFLLEAGSAYPEIADLGGGVKVVPQESYKELGKHCTASMVFPVVEGAKGKKALDAAFKKLSGGEMSKDVCEGSSADMPYTVEDDYTVTKAKLPHFGITFHSYSFTGGAHGMWGATCKVADADTGDVFALATKLTPENRKKLSALVVAALKKEHGVEKLSDAGFFVDDIDLDDKANVCVGPKGGLEVLFNPYEVGPWAMGAPTVAIAADDARPLLPADLQKTLAP